MKKQIYQTIAGIISLVFLFGALQAQTVTLTFTGKDINNNWVRLDHVVVTNLTKGWQETLVYPDTTLTMQNSTGIGDMETRYTTSLQLYQNNPNPFTDITDVNLTVADAGAVTLEIADVNGRIVETRHGTSLQPGTHQFRISLSAAGTYVLTARQNGKTSSVKMVCNGAGNGNRIEYTGTVVETRYTTSLQPKSASPQPKSITTNPFTFGDMMEYVGYATINGTEYESVRISQMQGASQTFALEFDLYASGLPIVSTLSVSNLTVSSVEVSGIVLSDGGSNVTERGFCWDTLSQPTLSNASLQCGAGIGNFIGVISGLMAETTYYVRAYATNGNGMSYGAIFSFTTPDHTSGNGEGNGNSSSGNGSYSSGNGSGSNHTYVEWDGEGLNPNDSYPCEGTPILTDIDGNVYNTVQIGNQCWMKENLRTTRYADSTEIHENDPIHPYRIIAPLFYASTVSVFGYLYSWETVMHGASSSSANPSGVQGICPEGWHMPSYAEWTQLIDYVRSQNEYQCGGDQFAIGKALAHEMGWSDNINTTGDLLPECKIGITPWGSNNATGFSALPAGYLQGGYGTMAGFSAYACIWSTTNTGNDAYRYCFTLVNFSSGCGFDGREDIDACSVRCLKD